MKKKGEIISLNSYNCHKHFQWCTSTMRHLPVLKAASQEWLIPQWKPAMKSWVMSVTISSQATLAVLRSQSSKMQLKLKEWTAQVGQSWITEATVADFLPRLPQHCSHICKVNLTYQLHKRRAEVADYLSVLSKAAIQRGQQQWTGVTTSPQKTIHKGKTRNTGGNHEVTYMGQIKFSSNKNPVIALIKRIIIQILLAA